MSAPCSCRSAAAACIAGVAAAIKLSRPRVRVVGVEPAGAPKMRASLAAGQPVTLPSTASIADGLMNLRAGRHHVRARPAVRRRGGDGARGGDIAAGVSLAVPERADRGRAERRGDDRGRARWAWVDAVPGTVVAIVSGGNVAAGEVREVHHGYGG